LGWWFSRLLAEEEAGRILKSKTSAPFTLNDASWKKNNRRL
jgi:hypothetical protein